MGCPHDEVDNTGSERLTLEGPNAGLAGDSDQRGDEAVIQNAGDLQFQGTDNITLTGFKFEVGSSGDGQIELGSQGSSANTESGLTFTDNVVDVEAAAEAGLRVDSNNALISNNEFTVAGDSGGTNTHGVQVGFDSRSVEVSDNTFTGDESSASGIGIYISSARDDVDGSTVIENNDVTGFDFGVAVDTTAGTYQLEGNSMSDGITADFALLDARSSQIAAQDELNGVADTETNAAQAQIDAVVADNDVEDENTQQGL